MQTSSNTLKRVLMGTCALSIAGLVAAWLWGVVHRVQRLLEAGAHLRADEALTAVIASCALLLTTWLSVAMGVELVARLPGPVGRAARTVATLVSPLLARRLFALLLGVGIAGATGHGGASAASVGAASVLVSPGPAGTAGPATQPLPDPGWPAAATPPDEAPEPGWVPSAPTVRPQPDVRLLSPSPANASRDEVDAAPEVVVRRGDSLWAIAARHLGQDPSESEIAEAWPAWYAANRKVIGPDPDLLLPGTVLRAPEEVGP